MRKILRDLAPLYIILFGIFPILLMMLASFITSLYGVTLNEGNAPDIPLGNMLYQFGIFALFSLMTIPIAIVAFIVYLSGRKFGDGKQTTSWIVVINAGIVILLFYSLFSYITLVLIIMLFFFIILHKYVFN